MAIIAGYKIDTIAEALTQPVKNKIKKIEAQMTKAATKVFIKKVPKDLLAVWEKYPKVVSTTYQFCIHIDNKRDWDARVYIDISIPDYNFEPSKLLLANPDLFEELNTLAKKMIALKKEGNQTSNQIKCALSKLRTYKKIEANFPEAYKILEKIDEVRKKESPAKEPTLCDDVEKLRAKLAPKGKEAKQ